VLPADMPEFRRISTAQSDREMGSVMGAATWLPTSLPGTPSAPESSRCGSPPSDSLLTLVTFEAGSAGRP
jgi:hypothetical protein